MTSPASLAVLAGALCLTGCGTASATASGSASTTQSPTEPATVSTQTPGAPTTTSTPTSPSPSATTTSTPATARVPSFGTGTRPVDGGYGSGNSLGLVDVRTARRPGFDRITFVLSGRGAPGFYVTYVRHPREDGSGDPVDIKGAIALQVILRGIGIRQDTGIEPFGNVETRVSGQGTSGVAEIAPGGGPFEGDQAAYVGLTGTRRPFRAFALTDPTRIVVDVRRR